MSKINQQLAIYPMDEFSQIKLKIALIYVN